MANRIGRVMGWLILCLSSVVTISFFFSRWAVNAEDFGKYDLGMAMAMSYVFASSIYASLGLGALAFVTGVRYVWMRQFREAKLYVVAFAIASAPIAYLIFLDMR